MRRLFFAVVLCLVPLATGGCAAFLPTILDAVVQAGQWAQWVRAAVDAAEVAAGAWFRAHPDAEVEPAVADAIARCRLALSALDEAALAAQATEDADLEAAKRAVANAYSDLYALLELAGAAGYAAGQGGPSPSYGLPTPAEVGSRL